MDYTIGEARDVQIEWQYGLSTLTEMIGISLPRSLRSEVIPGYADWSPRFNTGRVLRLALPDFDDIGSNPRYVQPGRSILDCAWTKQSGVIRKNSIGHPTILNQCGQVVQNEVYIDRGVQIICWNAGQTRERKEIGVCEIVHHVSETRDVSMTPFRFNGKFENRGNTLANLIGNEMHQEGYRPATLTETLWHAAKYQNEIDEDQILVPFAGYSGGYSEARQQRHHLGLPLVFRQNGVLWLATHEFLGQHMPVTDGVEYLAVKS